MNYQEMAEELFQMVLVHKNLFIDKDIVIRDMSMQLEKTYNKGYDDGQASKAIVKDFDKQVEAMSSDPNIKKDCDAILGEEDREKKLDAIVEEFKEIQKSKELVDNERRKILDKVLEILKD